MKTGLNQYICVLIFLTIFFFFPSGAFAAAYADVDEFYPGTPPTISEINQFKLDGQTLLEESGIIAQDTVVFKAIVDDFDKDEIKIEIELRQITEPFTGSYDGGILSSSFVLPLNEAIITRNGLANGQYHWRARAVDSYGLASDWQEFGQAGNVDFEVKLVPLYTQVESDYPSKISTAEWASLPYASGNAGCGRYISSCGCAITSSVMIARYHGFELDVNDNDINPKNINDWLISHNGYWPGGDLKWEKIPAYVNKNLSNSPHLTYDGAVGSKDTIALNSYIDRLEPNPAILKVAVWSQRLNKYTVHFIVADGKLTDTYTVKDPAFYNTKYLAQARGSYAYNYNNDFKELRLYKLDDPFNHRGVDSISINLASPAEILITDSQGRKLGKDPVSGVSYNEIPNSSYYSGGIGDPFDESSSSVEEDKFIYIPNPLNGNYDIKVIGTDSGEYHLYFDTQDTNGSSTINSFFGVTQTGLISDYSLDYNSAPGTQTEAERVVTTSDMIKDVEVSYNLGWITKKSVKDLFVTELKVTQQLLEQKEKQLKHFDELIEKAKNPKAKQELEKTKENYKQTMNKVITKTLNLFIKEVEFYQKKGLVNIQASELLINDARYIINHL